MVFGWGTARDEPLPGWQTERDVREIPYSSPRMMQRPGASPTSTPLVRDQRGMHRCRSCKRKPEAVCDPAFDPELGQPPHVVALLAWLPGLVDTGYAGHVDLSPAEQLAVHLPLDHGRHGASTAALVASGWVRRWWSSAVRLQYAALAVAAITLVPLLAGWHLIRWGMS
jgi:hypothetical protein